MNKFRFPLMAFAIAAFTVLAASSASAQATRTWVSGVGDDANPCSRTAPCKTFAGAISKTAAGGEIDALDPGGFGVVTITKSITIDGSGTFASILSSGSPSAVNINDSGSGSPGTIQVILRGLSINGAGTTLGINGVNFVSGKQVNIIDCLLQNFSGSGIVANLNQAAPVALYVVNSHVKHCGGDGANLTNANSAGLVKTTIERSSFVECGNGLHARANSRVVARNSVFSNNTSNGVFVDCATSGVAATLSVWASQISLNGTNGAQAGNAGNQGSSGLVVAQNQIDRNVGSGVLTSTGGAVNTFSNNEIFGNGTDGCPGCTPVGPGS
jgi:hypothetical protein